ncbi:MAG: MlaD family protein [Gemmatimonadota bacterium]|nr:MlaD family protein [Gemmatimonadota bacterium]
MARKANPTLIGLFVLGGVMLSAISVVVFGSGQMFRETQTVISFFDGSVSGLAVGAPVRFRGIDVGEVVEVLLDLPGLERVSDDIRIAVIYDLDRQRLESRGATARLDDPLDIDTLLGLGIRAELATESLVTGRKFVALDISSESFAGPPPVVGAPYPEIPTLNTGLERFEEDIAGIIAELGAVQLDELVTVASDAFAEIGALAATPALSSTLEELPDAISNLNETVADLQALVANLDETLIPIRDGFLETTEQAKTTMEQLEATLHDMGGVLEPESPLFVRFEHAMTDLSAASRALRSLADYLERNPSTILRGRPGGGP